MKDFSGWIPLRIYWRDSLPMVDWGFLGNRRFTEPFFSQTTDQCVQHPADLLFRHQTPLENLGELVLLRPALRPTGFIFHMSRCGSTLVSQMLAASAENIVLSEASPIDAILRARFRDPKISEAQQVQWLQWLVGVLAWQRHPAEKNVFIKFDCWHALFLPLIQRAFPGVPWIFVYRDPVEVMASQLGHRGAQMIPTVLEPELFGWDLPTIGRMNLDEYGVRVLAKICATALNHIQGGNGKLVHYAQLPGAVWPALLEYWQVNYSADESSRMLETAQMNAKNPVLPFEADSQVKQNSIPAELRNLTQHWLGEVYQQLESQRLATGFV